MVARIRVAPATSEMISGFVELSRTYYDTDAATATDPELVSWRHLEANLGPSTAVDLVEEDQVVGRMWVQHHLWSLRGLPAVGANPIDFLIREDHRRLPAFMSLFKAAMRVAEDEADLVYHSSNPLTDDLYRKLMKLKPVTELDGAVLPIRPFAAARAAKVVNLRGVGSAFDVIFAMWIRALGLLAQLTRVRLVGPPDSEQQASIVASFEREEAVSTQRSEPYRAWRFRGANGITYTTNWIQIGRRPAGYVVTTDRDVDGVLGRFIVDLVLPGRLGWLTRWSLWLQVAANAAKNRQHALFLFYNRQNERLAKRAGAPLVTVARHRLPQRIPVFVRVHARANTALVDGIDWGQGYFVLSDFDMF